MLRCPNYSKEYQYSIYFIFSFSVYKKLKAKQPCFAHMAKTTLFFGDVTVKTLKKRS
jgi:hypothetical protein